MTIGGGTMSTGGVMMETYVEIVTVMIMVTETDESQDIEDQCHDGSDDRNQGKGRRH